MTHLAVSVLGPLRVSIDGEPVQAFRSAKTRALLVYLAMESNRPHTRDALACLLWPDQPNQTARDNLRQTLAILRKTIGDTDAGSPLLDITRSTIQFDRNGDHSVDALSFETLLGACAAHRHRHSETCRTCAENRCQAVELYCGDFLDQFYLSDSAPFEEWALLKRERLRESALDALGQLVEFHIAQGNHKQALAFAMRQLDLDPWREEAHRQAMRALALDGRFSAALDHYESCRRGLANEMGVEPAQETIALYELIKEQPSVGPAQDHPSPPLVRLPPRNLPTPPTPLLGRAAELCELDRLLTDPHCRLISIIGPGGAGKTRLAIAAAGAQRTEFRDGVFFVSLASVDSSRYLATTLLASLEVQGKGQRDATEQLLSYVHTREILLVLDNMEHLLDGIELLATLLKRSPNLTLLVTSRERLNLQGEWVLDLRGLDIPEGQKVDEVERYSAVQLFVQNAKRARAARTFSDEDKAIIVRICRLVDGMPLAIELAASWIRTLSCREIADEIEKSFGFLTTALRDIPERHRSMRAVFQHSWMLLNEEERCVLRRLSVFLGAFQRPAAEEVAGANVAILAALVDKSLVRSTAPDWYDLHNLVRQFAAEELEKAKENEETRRRLADFYLRIAETSTMQLDGPDQAGLLRRLDAENANLRAALAWAVEGPAERVDTALRLCGALARTWDMRGYASEGRRWLDLALPLAEKVDPPVATAVRIKALNAAGSLAMVQGDHLAARSFHQQSLTLCCETENRAALGTCLMNLGTASSHLGEYVEGRSYFEKALNIYRELGNQAGIARTLLNMGFAAHNQGDYDAARKHYEESLSLRRQLGDQYGTANVLGNLAALATGAGELERARSMIEASLALRRTLGDQYGIANCLIELAGLAHREQDNNRAHDQYRQGLTLLHQVGDNEQLAACMEYYAEFLVDVGKLEQGIQLWGAANTIRETLGTPVPPSQRLHHEETAARVQSAYGQANFQRAWESGRSMSAEDALAYAQAIAE